jgi:hypothetical protein
MKKKNIIICVCGLFIILFVFTVLLLILREKPIWTYWAGEPLIYKEVVSIVWVRSEVSEKKSYKKFTDVNKIKEILKQIATPKPGTFSLQGKEKHELRIYFLDGQNYHVYFTIEGDEFIGPNGRNKDLYKILKDKEEAAPFWEDFTPEEIEKQAELMKEVIKEKKRLEKKGL